MPQEKTQDAMLCLHGRQVLLPFWREHKAQGCVLRHCTVHLTYSHTPITCPQSMQHCRCGTLALELRCYAHIHQCSCRTCSPTSSAATHRRCLVEGWLKAATSGLQRTHRIVFALKLPCSCISLYSVSSVIAVWVELDILHSAKKNLLKIENMCLCSSLFLFLWSYWQVLAFLMRLRTFYHCRALFL